MIQSKGISGTAWGFCTFLSVPVHSCSSFCSSKDSEDESNSDSRACVVFLMCFVLVVVMIVTGRVYPANRQVSAPVLCL